MAPAAAEMKVRSPAQHRGLRIQSCYIFGSSCSSSSGSIPGPGTSICHGCGIKNKAKQKLDTYFPELRFRGRFISPV